MGTSRELQRRTARALLPTTGQGPDVAALAPALAPVADRIGASAVQDALSGGWLDGLGPVVQLDVALALADVAEEGRLFTGPHERLREAASFATDLYDGEQAAVGVGGEAVLRSVQPHHVLAVLRHAYGEVPEATLQRVQSLLSGGAPLAPVHAARFSGALDHDLSHVRVHTDAAAARAADELSARAFAVGDHIFFAAGEFAPGTPGGDRLLAHELTHVVQHDEGRLPSGAGVSSPSDRSEREAYGSEDRILGRLDHVGSTESMEVVEQTEGAEHTPDIEGTALSGAVQLRRTVEQAQALLELNPTTDQARAQWLLDAAAQDFVTLMDSRHTRANLEEIAANRRPTSQVHEGDPVAALDQMTAIVRGRMQRWVAAGGGAYDSPLYGSMTHLHPTHERTGDRHGLGEAIDIGINANSPRGVNGAASALDDLTPGTYGVGMPFQGEFFNPQHQLSRQRQLAEAAATPSATELSATGLELHSPQQKQSRATKADDGSWRWGRPTGAGRSAEERLQSADVRGAIARARARGVTLSVFPDTPGHIHIDNRSNETPRQRNMRGADVFNERSSHAPASSPTSGTSGS